MERLKDQVAIVTGAASGMGKSIALLFAREGAKVVVSDLNLENAQLVVDEIGENGGTAFALVANVAKEDDIQNLINTTILTYGTLDILVNNAGIMDNFEPVEDITDDRWELIMNINAMGPMRTMRKAIPIFKEKGHGTIINIASVGGFQGARAGAIYTASKHAVIGITKNTGFMYAKFGIRCNAIAPGAVNTNIGSSITNPNKFGINNSMIGLPLSPRTAEPKEIAEIALFLATEDSSYINGAVIVADGGWTAY